MKNTVRNSRNTASIASRSSSEFLKGVKYLGLEGVKYMFSSEEKCT